MENKTEFNISDYLAKQIQGDVTHNPPRILCLTTARVYRKRFEYLVAHYDIGPRVGDILPVLKDWASPKD